MRKLMLFTLVALLGLHLVSGSVLSEEMFYKTGNQDGISFISGGIGEGERAEMERMAKDYNLKIVLATTTGPYLSEIPVMIYDRSGKEVFKIDAGGPWLYIHLKEGKYTIKASHEGKEKKKTVQIGRRLKMIMFHWPARLG